MRLYAFLGATLARAFPVDSSSSVSSTYRGWIDTYASSEFEAAASTVEQLLEQYSGDSSSSSGSTDEYSMLLHNYRLAMALEFSFFDACGEEAGLQGDPAALEVSAVTVNGVTVVQLPCASIEAAAQYRQHREKRLLKCMHACYS
jgi:hypothetical protein